MALPKEPTPFAPAPLEESTAPAAAVVKAKSTGERKGKQLSATVSEEFFDTFTDLKWDLRKDVPAMLREAAEDYVAKHKPADDAK